MRLSSEVLQHRGAASQSRPLHWAPLPAAPAAVPAPPRPPEPDGGRGEARHLVEQARAQAEAILASAREEAARLAEHAAAEGQARGWQEGWTKAREEAGALVAEATAVRERAVRERGAALDALTGEIAGLAVEVARQVLQREIEQSPEDVVRLTRRLLQRIESPAVLRVHPTLSPILEAEAATFGRAVEVRADPSVRPGGLVVESEEGVLDASVEGRLARVTSALGGGTPGGA